MNQRKQSNQYTFPVLFDTINFQMYLFEDLEKKITGISNFLVHDFFSSKTMTQLLISNKKMFFMAFCKEQIYVYILNILYDPREKKPVTEGEQLVSSTDTYCEISRGCLIFLYLYHIYTRN